MDEDIRNRIETMIKSNKIFLFMKGTPEEPQCGFSFRVVKILKEIGAEFSSFDVLSDMKIREGVKEYSDWPTIPQLYINGEFVGGCDIAEQLFASGELQRML